MLLAITSQTFFEYEKNVWLARLTFCTCRNFLCNTFTGIENMLLAHVGKIRVCARNLQLIKYSSYMCRRFQHILNALLYHFHNAFSRMCCTLKAHIYGYADKHYKPLCFLFILNKHTQTDTEKYNNFSI